MERADESPDARETYQLTSEAIRLLEAHQLRGELRYRANHMHLWAAVNDNHPAEALVAFGRMLAALDQDPWIHEDREDLEQFLIDYRTAARRFASLPQIPRPRIEAVVEDYRRRLEAGGFSPRAYLLLRSYLADCVGRSNQDALADFEAAMRFSRDGLADCEACETHFAAAYALLREDLASAEKIAAPLFSGAQSCTYLPHVTFGDFLRPFFFAGRFDEAERCHRRGLPLVLGSRVLVSTAVDHLEYLAFTGEWSRGLELARDILSVARGERDQHHRFEIGRTFSAWLTEAERQGAEWIDLNPPAGCGVARGNTGYRVPALRDWFRSDAERVGRELDARNGTDRYAQKLLETDEKLVLARRVRGDRPSA